MKRLLTSLLALCSIATLGAQLPIVGGSLSGSVESNSIYYMNDSALGDAAIKFGSNDYVKLTYYNDNLTVGLQGDAYLPALIGYDDIRNAGATDPRFALSQIFVSYRGRNFEVTAGDFFEQFGSGLAYRSFEDRQLGLNSATQGVRVNYSPIGDLTIKAFAGRPRLAVIDHAGSFIGGLDASYNLSSALGMDNTLLMVEGSYVARYEDLHKEGSEIFDMNIFEMVGLTTPLTHLFSGRANFDWNRISLKGEVVAKTIDLSEQTDPEAHSGLAVLGEASYSKGAFNIMAQGRLLKNMGTRLSLYDTSMGNALNYIPALTRQHTYLLANLEPHQVNTHSELAAQADLYYSIRNKKDRRNFWRFHANVSYAHNLEFGNLTWMDINVDVERQWNKYWKAAFMFSRQTRNPNKGFSDMLYTSNIFVADVTHKIDNKNSIRAELQYLYSNDYEGDWVAALLEYNMAPSWSIFVSDMYNHQRIETYRDKINYYSGGVSYTTGPVRVQLSYGRNRAGMVCSGGVCRYTPAYTGFNLLMSATF
ncbi:MAG: hypothetical protein IKB03_01765 [Tidjanibacter sp.]|nr:hypothetical protein [Tidjanibacter sp.]